MGLSFPDLSASHLSRYLSKCLSPSYPSLMPPEELDVHSLLNPFKNVEPAPLVTNQQRGSELQTIEVEHAANGKARPIIDADQSEKQTGKNIASEKDGLVMEPEIKAEIADDVFYEKYTSDPSINIHSCGVCYKTFENLHNLENHMVTHVRKSENIIACKECGKGFRKANKNCQQHKKFPCNGCGKEFREAHRSCSYHNRRIKGKISTPSCFSLSIYVAMY